MTGRINWPNGLGPQPTRTKLTIEPVTLPDERAARQWIVDGGGTGWICTIDRVFRFSGNLPEGEVPLQADIRRGEHEGASLRFDGVWSGWLYREGDGEEVLAVDEVRQTQDGPATWRVYWKGVSGLEGVAVWRPFAARLVRLGEEE